MARNLDTGYESPSEETALKNQIVVKEPARTVQNPLSPWKWASYFRWCSPRRYFLVAMLFLGFWNVYALQVSLSVALVDMTSHKMELLPNGSLLIEDPEFDWPQKKRRIILDSFYYGYIFSHIPGAYLASYFGPKKAFGIFIAIENLLLFPFTYLHDIYSLIGARILEGLSQGVTFPALYLILSKWVPACEKSKSAIVAISGCYFGVFVTLPLAKILIGKYNWLIAIDFFTMIAFTWAVLFFFIIAESPEEDPYISETELNYIQSPTENQFSDSKEPFKVPWKEILLSFPVWAIIIAHFCENWGFYTLLRVLPEFINDIYYNDFVDWQGSLPYLLTGISVLFGGLLASWLQDSNRLTTIRVRKIFTCGAFSAKALFLLLAAHSDTKISTITYLSIAFGLGGFAWSGFGVNHFDISPTYASFLIGLTSTFATLPGISSPAVKDLLVEHGNRAEWVYVYYLASSIYIFGAIFYGIYGSSEIQSWSRTESEPHQEKESQNIYDLPAGEPTNEE